ncbi:MAG TPA: serine/threonine-protein kinase [Kofleriaceae bacterium]|nr:serine/threonine-protein kinase [Kofleriaceae bacterium]
MVDGGGLGDQPAETVHAHIDACPTCAALIAKRGEVPDTALSPTLPAGPDTLAEVSSDLLPRAIGRYQVQDVLGAGGMGIVYAAWDPQLRRRVAIKLVRPERAAGQSRQQLLREARALARISHPNVVTAHDVGEHEGEIFVATELVAGQTLASWHAGRPAAEIVAAWLQAAPGLAAAHAEGVVHRDVKPSNVLVGADGRVRIGDFGLAHEGPVAGTPSPPPPPTSEQVVVTATGFFGGTPGYMAPEHENGKLADARSDQFSLCVSIAETLTGRRSRAGGRVDVQPPALASALERGLRADPSARFPSVAALADALAAAIAPRRRRWPLVAVAAGGAAIVALGGAGAWRAFGAGERSEACAGVEVPPDLWPASRRAALERTLAPGVIAHVEAWLAGWTAVAGDVCAPGRAEPEIRTRQRECLSGQLGELRALLDGWAATPPGDPMLAFSQMEEIGLPSMCSHRAVAETREPAVEAMIAQAVLQGMSDQEAGRRTARAAVAAAGGDRYARVLASIQLLSMLGGDLPVEATSVAEAARADLVALGGDPALEAQLDYHLGTMWSARRDYDQSIGAYDRSRRGFRAAFGPGNLYEALALHALAGVHMGRDGVSAKGAALLKEAASMYQRAGVFMAVPAQADDPAEVIEATQIALAQAQALWPDGEFVFRHECTLGDAHTVRGDNVRALAHYLRGIEIGERLKVRDARLAGALSQAAAIASELGRPAEGVAYARRAAALADEIGAESDIGTALTILGSMLLQTGQPAEARIHLTRALRLREKLREPGRFRGRTRYLLATALWPADRKRARELAYAARVDIQADIDSLPDQGAAARHVREEQGARLAEIDAWLRTHR